MTKWKGIVLFLVVALALTGCGAGNSGGDDGGQTAEDPAEVATAEQLYSNNCASCHGGNLEGAMGPALDTIGATLSQDEIADIIENGQGQMPAQTQVSSAERDELASWLADQK